MRDYLNATAIYVTVTLVLGMLVLAYGMHQVYTVAYEVTYKFLQQRDGLDE